MEGLTREQRSQRARIAVYTRWSKEDPSKQAAIAREGFNRRFLDEVDPDRVLPEVERNRRAGAALQAHMARLSFLSSKARAAGKKAP